MGLVFCRVSSLGVLDILDLLDCLNCIIRRSSILIREIVTKWAFRFLLLPDSNLLAPFGVV